MIDSIGDFNVQVDIDDDTCIRGFTLKIKYDNFLIDFLEAQVGSLFVSQPIGWWIVDEETTNTVRIECIIFGAGLYVQGPGNILSLQFTATSEGRSFINFVSSEYYDAAGNVISDVSVNNGNILIGTPSYTSIKVLLEGAYNTSTDTMLTLTEVDIPLDSPYEANYEIDSLPANTVDWVLVALRTSPSSNTLAQKSMLLNSDGTIIDPFFPNPSFLNIESGWYHIIIYHRNHIPIMTKTPIQLVESGFFSHVDLTKETKIFDLSSCKELETEVFGMAAGDVDQNGEITTSDYTIWNNSYFQGESGYNAADIHMDGQITTADYTKWYNNYSLGIGSTIPE